MISIKQLSDSTLSKHWDYFIASPGYARINEYANDLNISIEERAFYRNLLDDEPFLKELLLGTPSKLLKCIDIFYIKFQNIPHLKILLLPIWADIEKVINNKAKVKFSLVVVERNKREILNELSIIDELCRDHEIYPNLHFNENVINIPLRNLTIKKIKSIINFF